jgi:hypothetical protein
MSYNGSGVFVVNSSGQPVVASTLITAATFNAFTADAATGLSTAILKDGTQTVTADIPFNNKKLTGVAPGTLRTDAASIATIQDGTGVYVGTVGGTADVITLTASPAITAYAAGQTFRFIASGANTTNVTVAINGLAAKAITKNGTTALVAGDIPAAMIVEMTYDGTRFILGTVFVSLTGYINQDIVDAKGDLIVATAADAMARMAVGTTTGHALIVDPSTASGLSYAHRAQDNPIINGNMEIWQRGTTFAITHAVPFYSADRFYANLIQAGATYTVNRSTNVPTVAEAGVLFNYSLEVDVTAAMTAPAAGDYAYIRQIIEGYNWRHFAQRAFTISFWVMSTKTGTCVAAVSNGVDRTYPAEYTVSVTNTWEKKSITIPASPSAGTWGYTNSRGLDVYFVMASGSTFHGTANTWNSDAKFATANQVNAMDSTANFFRITGVKLELGSVATPIQFRSFQEELALSQRYYQKSFTYGTAPVQAAGISTFTWTPAVAGAVSGKSPMIRLAPPMRIAPTVTTMNPVNANAQAYNLTDAADLSATSGSSGDNWLQITTTGTAGTALGEQLSANWTADAEL